MQLSFTMLYGQQFNICVLEPKLASDLQALHWPNSLSWHKVHNTKTGTKYKAILYMLNSAHRLGKSLALSTLDPVARNGWLISATPRPLYPWERNVTHCKGGGVGLRDSLDASGKFRPPPEFEPWNTQPYTDKDVPVTSKPV